MYSRTLIKLIDAAIFPAVVIVASKILGIAFLAKYFDASYRVDGLSLVFSNSQDFISINSYSSLIMYFAVCAGLFWVVFKAHVFHDTHIKPALSARLLEMNMVHMIHKTDVIFSESFVWMSYAWLTTFIIGGYSFYGLGYWFVFYIALGVTLLLTGLLSIDIEREIRANSGTKIKMENEGNGLEVSIGNKRLLKITELSKELG